MKAEVKSKVIPMSFLKIERKGNFRWDERPGREGQSVELVSDQNSSFKVLPKSKKRAREGSNGDIRKGVTTSGAMEKSMYGRIVYVRKRVCMKKFRGDDPTEYFLHTGVRSTF